MADLAALVNELALDHQGGGGNDLALVGVLNDAGEGVEFQTLLETL